MNPNVIANKTYPASEFTALRQKTLIHMANAQNMLTLIIPSLGQSNGTRARPKTDDPLIIDSYDVILFMRMKTADSNNKLT